MVIIIISIFRLIFSLAIQGIKGARARWRFVSMSGIVKSIASRNGKDASLSGMLWSIESLEHRKGKLLN